MMLIEFDIQKLENSTYDFYTATGMSISIFLEDYSLLSSKKNNNRYCSLVQNSLEGLQQCLDYNRSLLEKCKKSKKTEISICPYGLVEIAIPILYGEDIIGYMMLGHIREDNSFDIKNAISGMSIDVHLAEKIYISLPPFDRDKIKAITNIALVFVKHIILEKLIIPREISYFNEVEKYVIDNIGEKLTARKIANALHVSQSTLYNIIKEGSGLTINEYVRFQRIKRAKELLKNNQMSIKYISKILGFSSTSYFEKVFNHSVGMSPSKYRKSLYYNWPKDEGGK